MKYKSITLTLNGAELSAAVPGNYTAVRNDGIDTIYISAEPGIVPNADGVISIPAGSSVVVNSDGEAVFLLGTGSVLLVGSDKAENPFRDSAASGGSGADEQARAAITAHTANTDVHVTAAEKSVWNGKAELSDIPSALPANGGSADRLGGRLPEDFANNCNSSLDQYLSGKSGDIRELAHLLPPGGFSADTGWFDGIEFPISGLILATWTKSSYKSGNQTYLYGVLIIRPLNTTGDTYICSVYNTTLYSAWQKLADGGNAASLGGKEASSFALKTEYDSLSARVAALEAR